MSDASPQAGWYADPENPAGERWWNGAGWSDHRRDSTVVAEFAPVDTAVPDYAAGPAYAGAPSYAMSPTAPAAASPYVAPPYGAPAPGQGVNGLAIAGLIVSAVAWLALGALGGIAGIILSAFGLAQARRAEAVGNPNSGRGLALAGIVVGIAVTVLGVLVIVVYIAFLLNAGLRF